MSAAPLAYISGCSLFAGHQPGEGLPDSLFSGLESDFIRTADRISQLTLLGMRAALPVDLCGERLESTGVVCGIDIAEYPSVARALHRMRVEGLRSTSPQEFALSTPNVPHSLACIRLGLRGLNTQVACGTLSSLSAIGVAAQFIASRRAPRLLAGGASSLWPPLPEFARAFGISKLTETCSFALLTEERSPVAIIRYIQRHLSAGDMTALIAETLAGSRPDLILYHPGREMHLQGLPSSTTLDVRDLHGECLDASGTIAVHEAFIRIRCGEAHRVLIVQRDISGHDGAALLIEDSRQ